MRVHFRPGNRMGLGMALGATLAMAALPAGCTTYTTRVENAPGRPTVYNDPATVGPPAGVGLESQDLISMTDKMMRDMLASPAFAGRTPPPRVIIDAEYFKNEGSTPLNKNIITDRLRVELNRAAAGRMVFVGRHAVDMVEQERSLKREGVVDPGTTGQTRATLGGDYRLTGRIATIDAVGSRSGARSRYHQIVFEMVDLETAEIVWSGIYGFRKTAQDDVIYR
ncbi:MAG TPA: penicillin-binding protein activator LpoB [Sumerlaeia bacterium]|nr:penicillin-binding protein activator LpoB [Sumerlaeia bacterium]